MKLVKPSADEERERPARRRRRRRDLPGHDGGARTSSWACFRVPAGRAVAPALPRELRERALHALGRASRSAGATTSRSRVDGRAGRHALRAAARDAHRRATSPTPSRPSTSSRATARRRTRSRCPGGRDDGAMTRPVLLAFAAGAATGAALNAWGPARFARMSGSSIAAPDAAPWTTDFLNAAYFRRDLELRDIDDLRLAFAILTTRWHRLGHRRLRATDAPAFHRAFGRHRFLDGRGRARHAQPRAAPRGRRAPARRLVPGRLRGRRAARMGHRLRGRGRPRRLPARDAAGGAGSGR